MPTTFFSTQIPSSSSLPAVAPVSAVLPRRPAELAPPCAAAFKTVVAGSGGGRTATQAALVRLLGSARRLRARLASMDHRAPAPAAHAVAGLRGRAHDLTADVQALRRQVSAACRDDAARRFLAVAGAAPTEEQLERLLATGDDSDAAMRAALLSGEEQAVATKEVAEVERGLLELQQLFLDMVALVDAQGARVDDIERHAAVAAGDVGVVGAEFAEAQLLQGAARRRRLCLAGGVAALVLVAVAVAVVAALILSRRGGQQARNLLPLQLAADLDISWRLVFLG